MYAVFYSSLSNKISRKTHVLLRQVCRIPTAFIGHQQYIKASQVPNKPHFIPFSI
jgi:hypothetical protein